MSADVDDVMTGAARALTERLRDVRLADARATDEQNVLLALAEAAGREIDDLRLRDLRFEVEVEVLERARVVEGSAPKPHLELLAVAALDLVGEQAKQRLAVRRPRSRNSGK